MTNNPVGWFEIYVQEAFLREVTYIGLLQLRC